MRRIYIKVYRYVLRFCDRTLVLTEQDLRLYLKYYSFESAEIAVLPNSVDLSAFNLPDHVRRHGVSTTPARAPAETRLVVMIARLEPQKDWLTFLRVAQELTQNGKRAAHS